MWGYIALIVLFVCLTCAVCYAMRCNTKRDINQEINELKIEINKLQTSSKSKDKIRQPSAGPVFSYTTYKKIVPKE